MEISAAIPRNAEDHLEPERASEPLDRPLGILVGQGGKDALGLWVAVFAARIARSAMTGASTRSMRSVLCDPRTVGAERPQVPLGVADREVARAVVGVG